MEKAHVAARLVAQVRGMNPPGRFLKEDSDNAGMFLEIGDQKAWKKAGQALREDAPEIRKELDTTIMNTSHPKKSIPAIAVCLPRSSNNN
jgi:3-oxoacyl-[acyl-carrier-protein] synthase III